MKTIICWEEYSADTKFPYFLVEYMELKNNKKKLLYRQASGCIENPTFYPIGTMPDWWDIMVVRRPGQGYRVFLHENGKTRRLYKKSIDKLENILNIKLIDIIRNKK